MFGWCNRHPSARFEDEEYEWDCASKRSLMLGAAQADSWLHDDRVDASRALCSECGKPLRHVSEFGCKTRCFVCGTSQECDWCEERIAAGELHFVCDECDMVICRRCGPGVCVERVYDFVNPSTGEVSVKPIARSAWHSNKGKRVKKVSVRSKMYGGTPEHELALSTWRKAKHLMMEVSAEKEDVFDKEWRCSGLIEELFGDDAASTLRSLAEAAASICERQETLVKVKLPCKIFGDLHGQLRDLLLLMHHYGTPGEGVGPFVFNGDFVDRGAHQLEVIGLLFALKVAFPTSVFLIRGNHEDYVMNEKYGFRNACYSRFGQTAGMQVYEACQKAFCMLPMAGVVGGRILVVHGGIGDGKWSLDDLSRVRRPLLHKDLQAVGNEFLWNLLWSDPVEEDQSRLERFGVHQSPRSKVAWKFGWDVTSKFCSRNGIDMIVRSHQAKRNGFGFEVMHDEGLVNVFSARDYERNGNDGAVLLVSLGEGEDSGGVLTVRPQVIRSLTKERKSAA